MNSRVKQIRNVLNLTLDKFSKPLGLTRAAMSNIENGNRKVTNQLCKSICNVNWDGKYVNEKWLLTGQGEMFIINDKTDKYLEAASKLSNDPLIVSIITSYFELDEQDREKIKNLINTICQAIIDSKNSN